MPSLTPDDGKPSEDSGTLAVCDAAGARIALRTSLIAALEEHVDEGARALPRVGAEVGGILVGPRGKSGGGILVDQTIPVSTEYRFGPVYHLSIPDLSRLAESIAAVDQDGSRAIVGFYRSQTRAEAGLRTIDLELLDTLERMYARYSADFRLFLVLSREGGSEITASPHVRTGKTWSAAPEFRLSEGAGAPMAASKGSHRRRWLYPAIVTVVAAGTFAGLWFRANGLQPAAPPNAEPPRAAAALGLSARREGAAWRLAWDGETVAKLMPAGAALLVRAGGDEQRVPLTAGDLAAGTVLTPTQGSDILFTLSVEPSGGGEVQEQIRVLDPNAGLPAPPQVRPATPARTPLPAAKRIPPAGVAGPAADRAAPARRQVSTVHAATPQAIELPEPQQPQRGTPDVTALKTELARVPQDAPRAPAPAPVAPPPATSAAQPVYQPPKAIRKVVARKPPMATISRPVEVRLRVEVDARGKVSKVTALNKTATNARFVDSAVAAARFWQFEAARENGRAVPGEAVLTFRFAP